MLNILEAIIRNMGIKFKEKTILSSLYELKLSKYILKDNFINDS